MKSLSESLNWIDQQQGKWLDWPNSGSGAQCTDLPAYYMKFHGVAWPGAAAAKDLWDRNLDANFERSNVPKPGAIAVWSGKVGSGFGHEALVREVYADGSFRSLDQNYKPFDLNNGSAGAWVKHNMNNILGFWVPKFAPEPAPTVLAPAAPLPTVQAGAAQHKVVAGDTFWGLEDRYSWPHGILQQLNPQIEPRALKIGAIINIPSGQPVKPTPQSAGRRYTIMPGDTFWGIEERFGLKHGILQEFNPSVNPKALQIRSEINLP